MAAFVSPQRYIGLDISERELEKARKLFPQHQFRLLDITDKQQIFPDFHPRQFDTVLLLTVLEFISEPISIVETCRELLNDDGRIIVAVPSVITGRLNEFLYRRAASPAKTVNYFNKRSLEKLLTKYFAIETFRRYNLGLSYFVVAHPKRSIN